MDTWQLSEIYKCGAKWTNVQIASKKIMTRINWLCKLSLKNLEIFIVFCLYVLKKKSTRLNNNIVFLFIYKFNMIKH